MIYICGVFSRHLRRTFKFQSSCGERCKESSQCLFRGELQSMKQERNKEEPQPVE
jgi:hypothetical protein